MDDDRGDVITAYLLRLVGGLAVAGLLTIEVAAVAVNRLGLEEAVHQAADRAATVYLEHRSTDAAQHAARQRLQRADAELVDFAVEPDAVSVTASRPATVLISDRIDALSHLVTPSTRAESPLRR